ncbi:MAG: hypothetical protein KAV82_12720 [Phycisphaerae bacterium]|nr:hypothetical protein [Phycisphaerae bacterium]
MTQEQPNYDDREFMVSRYMDGDLTVAERRQFEVALRDDPELADLLESYRQAEGLILSLRESGPELDWQRFTWEAGRRRKLRVARKSRWVSYRLYAPLAAAAVIALVCTAHVMFFREGGQPMMPAPQAMVQVNRPAGSAASATGEAVVVVVRQKRIPPSDVLVEAFSSKSYVIAAAGAEPFDRSWDTQEVSPYF